MTYSREKLDSISPISNKSEYDEIVSELVNKVIANETITLAEERFTCGIARMLRTVNNELAFDINNYKSCKDFTFIDRYLIYYNDLNGHRPVFDAYGEIPYDVKRKDVEYLNNEFINWQNYIRDKNNGDELINHIAKETNQQLKNLKIYCNERLIGCNYRNYLEKSITLHGKHIYLLVKEYYQELKSDKQIIELNSEKILIDSFTYVHIMFRHYSKRIKEHQVDKSYHFDENIGFKIIPNFIFELINCYKSEIISQHFNNNNLYFVINDTPYVIYLKAVVKHLKGNKKIKYFRVQTFYPIEDLDELKKIKSYKLYKSKCGFDFLMQKSHNNYNGFGH